MISLVRPGRISGVESPGLLQNKVLATSAFTGSQENSAKAYSVFLNKTGSDNQTMLKRPPKVRCRQIGASDVDAIAELLSAGFTRHQRDHWIAALQLLSRRTPPEGFPKYGYMLESGCKPVGVILLICSQHGDLGEVRCNGSSWYVAPDFRSFASLLLSQTLRHPGTHVDVSPAPHTFPILEALGFKRFCNGAFAAFAAHEPGHANTKVMRVSGGTGLEKIIPEADLQTLNDHAAFGCISLWCETEDGGYPFVFRRRFVKRLPLVPAAQLVYCRGLDGLIQHAGQLARFLALRGMPYMILPANGPVPRLRGRYFDGKTMYYHGPSQPRLGDLAYTEVAMFGY